MVLLAAALGSGEPVRAEPRVVATIEALPALADRHQPVLVIDESATRAAESPDPSAWLWETLGAMADSASPKHQVDRFCVRIAPTVVSFAGESSTGLGVAGRF